MPIEYPTQIMSHRSGVEAITTGHGLTDAEIAEVQEIVLGDLPEGWVREVEEVFYHWSPRIKWCSRWDGWGCDNEGEWHGHWFAVHPNSDPSTWYTIVRHIRPQPSDHDGSEQDGNAVR